MHRMNNDTPGAADEVKGPVCPKNLPNRLTSVSQDLQPCAHNPSDLSACMFRRAVSGDLPQSELCHQTIDGKYGGWTLRVGQNGRRRW